MTMYDNIYEWLEVVEIMCYKFIIPNDGKNNTELLDSIPYNYHLQKMFQKMTVSLK